MNAKSFVQRGLLRHPVLLTALVLLVVIGARAQTNCTSAPSGLVSWWRAEGDSSDAVGSNNGTPHSGVTFTNGEVGQAFSFDGTSNAFIEVPDAPELRLTSEVTIEFWVKRKRLSFPSSSYADYIVEKGGDWSSGQNNYAAALNNESNNFCLTFFFAGGWRGGGTVADVTTWHHCAITARSGDPNPTLYIDSVERPVVYSKGPLIMNIHPSTLPLHIGAQLDPSNLFYSQVLLDELSIYSRVLSAAEIQAIYEAGAAGKCVPSPTPPTITSQPADATVNAGAAASFDVSVNGTSPFSYQWYFNGGALANGTTRLLSLPNVTPSQAGTYFVVVANAYGTVTSSNATLTVLTFPPTITNQPVDFTASAGDPAFFNVGVSGTSPLQYQWFFNGGPLANRTDQLLWLPNVSPSQAGTYFVVVTNAYGTVTSSNATLTVLTFPPTITHQPSGTNVFVGANIGLIVLASGSPTLTFQWQKDGTPLAGATSSTYHIVNAQVTNSGIYSVTVTNPYGSVTSSNATVTVRVLPPCVPPTAGLVSWWRGETTTLDNWDSNDGIMPLPTYGPGKVGQAFVNPRVTIFDSFSLHLTNSLTLQAWVNPTLLSGVTPYTIISKFDSPNLQGTGNQSSFWLGTTNSGQLLFQVSGTGSQKTNTALLGPVLPLNQWSFVVATYDGTALRLYLNGTLTAQLAYSGGIFPGNQNLGIGDIPNGIDYLAFYWPFSGSIDEVCIYNRALIDSEIQDIYTADISGMCLQAPVIVTQPQTRAVPLGEDVLFSAGVQGNRPLRYQWFFNSHALQGATNSSLVLERISTNQAGAYSVSVTNSVGFAQSDSANLTLLPAPTCTHAPDGMISWWPANNSPIDVVGTNNASLYSGATYTTGKVGQAFAIFPVSPPFGQIYAANSPSLNFGSNADFSIEAWVKAFPNVPRVGSLPHPGMIIVQKRTSYPLFPEGPGYALTLYEGRLAFWLCSSATVTNPAVVASGPDLRDAMFHHLAVTVQRSLTNGGRLYVDGQLLQTFDPTVAWERGSLSNTVPLYIASGLDQPDDPLNGFVDELAIYNRALTADEIMAIRTAGAAGKCDQPPLASSFYEKGLQDEVLVIPAYRFLLFGYDPDGDPLSLFSISSPSQGGRPVVLGTNQVTYTPAAGFLGQDSFTYTLSDGHGGRTSATTTVYIEPRMAAAATLLTPAPPGPGGVQLSFSGYAERTYTVQRAESLEGPWTDLGTVATDTNGLAHFTDPSPPPVSAYYRAVYGSSRLLPLEPAPEPLEAW